MVLSRTHGRDNKQGIVLGLLIALAGAVFLMNTVQDAKAPNLAGSIQSSVPDSAVNSVETRVGFTAMQMGEAITGIFEQSDIVLIIDRKDSAASSLNATVKTTSVNTGDGQTDSTIVTANWFASDEFPDATFSSEQIDQAGVDGYTVTGVLTIRGVSQPISFPMAVTDGRASGSFTIDRKVYGVGNNGQDEFVDPSVTIQFEATASNP